MLGVLPNCKRSVKGVSAIGQYQATSTRVGALWSEIALCGIAPSMGDSRTIHPVDSLIAGSGRVLEFLAPGSGMRKVKQVSSAVETTSSEPSWARAISEAI